MAKVLDLNSTERAIMDLVLQDDDRTVVHLDTPTEALVAELENMSPELDKLRTGDKTAVVMIYDLAARLISCNFDFFKVTGQELREKYRMNLLGALTFYKAYMDCITEITNAKN